MQTANWVTDKDQQQPYLRRRVSPGRHFHGLLGVLVGAALLSLRPANPTTHLSRVQATLSKLPLYFIENRGQVDGQVAYYIRGRDTSLYFTPAGVTFVLTKPQS